MSGRALQLIIGGKKNINPLYRVTGITHNPSVQGERVQAEIKELVQWGNSHLKDMPDAKVIEELETDLGDGLTLLHLSEELACEVPPCYHDNPLMRFQKIENINGCLQFLDERGVNIMNIHATGEMYCYRICRSQSQNRTCR
ncbi:uncharacterized protein LOC144436876 [Glandiceps talaboti]